LASLFLDGIFFSVRREKLPVSTLFLLAENHDKYRQEMIRQPIFNLLALIDFFAG